MYIFLPLQRVFPSSVGTGEDEKRLPSGQFAGPDGLVIQVDVVIVEPVGEDYAAYVAPLEVAGYGVGAEMGLDREGLGEVFGLSSRC